MCSFDQFAMAQHKPTDACVIKGLDIFKVFDLVFVLIGNSNDFEILIFKDF